jgi:uncharacterized membrane protein
MRTSKHLEAFQLSVILGMFGASATLWTRAPMRMPVHWDLAGEPDRYAGRFEGLQVTLLVALTLYGLTLLPPWIDPRRRAYEAFARGYQIIRLAMILFCAAIHAMILLVALGHRVNVSLVVPVGVGILFCILGNFMRKFCLNWFVGVRTPWTLSSAASCNKTDRLAGRLFLLTGVAMFVLAVLHNAWTLAIVLGLVALLVIWLPLYPYLIWRQDPQRVTKADAHTCPA